MLKHRFRLPSPALVIALIALFAALGGTSFAATKVIAAKHKDAKADTKLVKKLAPSLSVKHANTASSANNAAHATTADSATNAANATNATHATSATSATSATNATNATNATHATSATTAAAATGLPGPLASGQTERGTFGLAGSQAGATDFVSETGISFPIPLASTPTLNFVDSGPTAQCPGSVTDPTAAAGQLCLYADIENNANDVGVGTATRFGYTVFPILVAGGNYELTGTWAVTAP